MKSALYFAAAGALLALGSGPLFGAEIAYYRFEDTPGFLAHSSGNGNTLTTVGSVNPATLPAGSRGAAFPSSIPLSFAANQRAADLPGNGNYFRSASGLTSVPSNAFTLEAFLHWDSSAHTNESFADVLAAVRTGSNIGWVWQMRTDGIADPNGELFLTINDGGSFDLYSSGFNTSTGLMPDTDYYFATIYDQNSPTIDFLVQDLTNNGPLQTFQVANNTSSNLPATATTLEIGGLNLADFDFDGLIDELRISDTALPLDQLLIFETQVPLTPEPSALVLSATLLLAGLAHAAWRRRRSAVA